MADKADRINSTSFRFRDFCQTNIISEVKTNNPAQPSPTLHQLISDRDPTRLDHALDNNNIPAVESSNGNAESRLRLDAMQCCCGRPECVYLEHNNAALGGLERDLETAARLGQVRSPASSLVD